MKVELEKLVEWSKPKRVETRNGPRLLRKAAPTDEFSAAWKANKDALKAAGISWSKDERTGEWSVVWWMPLDAGTVAKETAAIEASRALTPEQERRLAEVTSKLLSYQVPSVRRQVEALKVFGGALDASDTGTGKTFTNLATCIVLGLPAFVVCPKAVIPSWRRAAEHFGIKLAGICNYELLRRGEQKAVTLVGEGKEQDFEWKLPKDTVLIFDEIHRCKDYKTWNCALGLSALRQGYKVLGLSATAADNPMQMKFSGLLTRQFEGEKKFFGWMLRNGVAKGRWGFEFTGGKAVLDRIHTSIFPEHGTRIKISDLGDQFPETQITAEAYECNGNTEEIDRVYLEMERELDRLAEKESEDGELALTIRLRARQRTEILKVPAIAALAQDAVDEGMSVAVFVNFNDSADALAAKLKTRCFIRGGQTDAEREKCIADFQADREPVIVCNIKAGGVGVSLHGSPTSRMRLSIICVTDSAQDAKQALGRVWRAKGAKSIQKFFFAAGTVEENDILPNMQAKIANIDTLNDGDLTVNRKEVRCHTVADAEQGQNDSTSVHRAMSNTNGPTESRTGRYLPESGNAPTGQIQKSSVPKNGEASSDITLQHCNERVSGIERIRAGGRLTETSAGSDTTKFGWNGGDAIQRSQSNEHNKVDTAVEQPRQMLPLNPSREMKSSDETKANADIAGDKLAGEDGTLTTSNHSRKEECILAATSVSLAPDATLQKQQNSSELSTPEQAVVVTDTLREHVHSGLKRLAACDHDWAMEVNGAGFSKMDGAFGHALAEQSRLSDKQTLAGIRLVTRYRRQLGESYSATLKELVK